MPGHLVRASDHLVYEPGGHLVWDNRHTISVTAMPSWYKDKTAIAYSATDSLSLSDVWASPVYNSDLTDGTWLDNSTNYYMTALSEWWKSSGGSGSHAYSVSARLMITTHRLDVAALGLEGYALVAIKKDWLRWQNDSTDGGQIQLGYKTNDATTPNADVDWITDPSYVVLTTAAETIYTLASPLVLSSRLWLTPYISNSFEPPSGQYVYPGYNKIEAFCSQSWNPNITFYFDRP